MTTCEASAAAARAATAPVFDPDQRVVGQPDQEEPGVSAREDAAGGSFQSVIRTPAENVRYGQPALPGGSWPARVKAIGCGSSCTPSHSRTVAAARGFEHLAEVSDGAHPVTQVAVVGALMQTLRDRFPVASSPP